jgi:hypothetical protein
MEALNRDGRDSVLEYVCELEWFTLAIEAARRSTQQEDSTAFLLEYSHYYTDELMGL